MFQARMRSATRVALAAVIGILLWGPRPAAAQEPLHGDCNGDGVVTLGEVLTCAGIFLGVTPLATCPACDRTGNGRVSIAEVLGAAFCFTNPEAPNCRPVTPPPPTPTPTPVPPTATPVPPSPTDTPIPPSPTDTPIPPTPTATSTPAPATPTPTHTATAEPTEPVEMLVYDVTLQAPGATVGNCRGTCVGGANAGADCGLNQDCPGSTCGGARVCVGGPFDGDSCTSGAQCGTCRPTATDPDGSCAIIQGGALKLAIAPNGVCVPRTAPDVSCVTDAECPAEKTCRLPSMRLEIAGAPDGNGHHAVRIDPDSFFLPPAPLPVGGITACIVAGGEGVGFIDCAGGAQGINALLEQDHNTTPQGTCLTGPDFLQPCTTAANCAPDPAVTFPCHPTNNTCQGGSRLLQPCTTAADCPDFNPPCSSGNSGPAVSGFADDPFCENTIVTPLGTEAFPCREGTSRCVGGENEQQLCSVADDCPDGTCAPCATAVVHPHICRSAVRATIDGTFDQGDMLIVFPLAITQLLNAEFGPDGLPCTEDDQPANPPAAVPVTLSTGRNAISIFDANNASTSALPAIIGPGQSCAGPPCSSETVGVPVDCSLIDGPGALEGVAIGGGFPALDINIVGDIATTFKFVIERADPVP